MNSKALLTQAAAILFAIVAGWGNRSLAEEKSIFVFWDTVSPNGKYALA
jgi:hypothetical protein